MSIKSIMENIPDYKAFLTVDELDAELIKLGEEFPDKVTVFEAGKSRNGHQILCAKIGSGTYNALMFGCPHPNEPIGAMMAHYFSRAIATDDEARNEMDLTWYIMPVSDVDGTKLNEGWFKGPFTLYHYTRNYFRPAAYEQVEWTFPMHYKDYDFDNPIPETKALMKIIDEIKPKYLFSLHNSGFGGAYWYITEDTPEVYPAFHQCAHDQNVPIDLGEPEAPYLKSFAPAIFKMLTQADTYDFYEKYTDQNPVDIMTGGSSSAEYAGDSCTTLITEVPYFYEPRIESDKIIDMTRREAVMKRLENTQENYEEILPIWDQIKDSISEDNPFAKMVEQGIDYIPASIESEKGFVQNNPDFAQPCKESEALSNLDIPKFSQLFTWALIIRSIEHELAKTTVKNAEQLKKLLDECEIKMKEKAEDAEQSLDYKVIPIKSLVSIQLGSALSLITAKK